MLLFVDLYLYYRLIAMGLPGSFMGKIYETSTDRRAEFIEAQHMFFVATAPKKEDGLVNVSPKGYDSFRILGPRQVGYLDMTGSGVETIAHVKENGRLTIMFVAFEGRALILRLYGNARVYERGDDGYDELLVKFCLLYTSPSPRDRG